MKFTVRTALIALTVAAAATLGTVPLLASGDGAVIIDEDNWCMFDGAEVGIPPMIGHLHDVGTPSGNGIRHCSAEIPDGFEPDRGLVLRGGTCVVQDGNSGTTAWATDVRRVFTPGGEAMLTCKLNGKKGGR